MAEDPNKKIPEPNRYYLEDWVFEIYGDRRVYSALKLSLKDADRHLQISAYLDAIAERGDMEAPPGKKQSKEPSKEDVEKIKKLQEERRTILEKYEPVRVLGPKQAIGNVVFGTKMVEIDENKVKEFARIFHDGDARVKINPRLTSQMEALNRNYGGNYPGLKMPVSELIKRNPLLQYLVPQQPTLAEKQTQERENAAKPKSVEMGKKGEKRKPVATGH